jgi:hypothetical protein
VGTKEKRSGHRTTGGDLRLSGLGSQLPPELASAERVMRKKIDANEFARCKCGSTDIEVGEYLRSS